MSCPLCATNVDKQLLKVPGVQAVKVNLNTGVIRVQVDQDQPPSSDALAKAINESGFTLVGAPRNPWNSRNSRRAPESTQPPVNPERKTAATEPTP